MSGSVAPSKPTDVPRVTPGIAALVVLWGALAGAQAELAARWLLTIIRPALGPSFHINPLAIGVGPLVNLPIFAVVGALAWVVGRRFRRLRAFDVMIFAVTGLAVFEVALVTQQVHPAALAILAAGIASVASRLASRFPVWSLRVIRATALVMIAAAIAGSAVLIARPRMAEAKALAAAPAARPGAPNVLILILDTVRAIELGMYGSARNTSPSLDSLARAAIRFEHAYSTAPWTLPSHTSMLTGRYMHEVSTDWVRPYNGQYRLLSELLRDHGYATGAFIGNLIYLNRRWGLNRGFMRYEDYQVDATVLWSTSSLSRLLVSWVNTPSHHRILVNGTSAAVIRKRFRQWQQSLGDRSFFAFVNFFDAHEPYGAPAPYDTMFLGRRTRSYEIVNWRERDRSELEELRAGYQQAIAYLDSQVGVLIEDLRQRGVLDRTLLIITADHGEDFAEHGFMGHGSSVHTTQARVPLLILPPGWRDPVVIDDNVTLRDLAATVGDFTGLAAGTVPGTSLARYWRPPRGDSLARSPVLVEVSSLPGLQPWYPSSRGRLQSIVEGRMRYTVQDGGGEWLYDLQRDPLELNDLSKRPAYQSTLDSLRAALQKARGSSGSSAGSR